MGVRGEQRGIKERCIAVHFDVFALQIFDVTLQIKVTQMSLKVIFY